MNMMMTPGRIPAASAALSAARNIQERCHNPGTLITTSRTRYGHNYHHVQRWKSTDRRSTNKTATTNLPPLPPPSSGSAAASHNQKEILLSPAQAKQRYLESKRRTEEFLKDPEGKLSQLQNELNGVKEEALAKLQKEVYDKTFWQRLTDRIKRKQHSFINMICASFAYVLAYNLHLKSKAHKEALQQAEEQRAKAEEVKAVLRSLVDDQTINEIADKVLAMDVTVTSSLESSASADTSSSSTTTAWWRFSPLSSSSPSSSSPTRDVVHKDKLVMAIRSVLEDKIGDNRFDDDTKKQKAIEKIWINNQEQLRKQQQSVGQENTTEEDLLLAAVLPQQILVSLEGDVNNDEPSTLTDDSTSQTASSSGTTRKARRVFDM